ncbi:unnamed protein product [Danaus chrysippus]|uniref:(African queen) hypothetical protein n=1 Tax=Danaus chrysippus TaxID=151541 RepID=A0A8J2R837_9NEOP|nr:unnamed protein product [Danaus chrysippus]
MIGVASVAGIISRNDRYSSIGGIQFINPFLSSQNNKRNTNKDNQAIASGYIEMRPGSVTASSSTSIDNGSHKQTPWSTFNPMPWPINPYIHARDLARQRNIEEWLHRDIFENLAPNMQMNNGWMYPTFDPFINY